MTIGKDPTRILLEVEQLASVYFWLWCQKAPFFTLELHWRECSSYRLPSAFEYLSIWISTYLENLEKRTRVRSPIKKKIQRVRPCLHYGLFWQSHPYLFTLWGRLSLHWDLLRLKKGKWGAFEVGIRKSLSFSEEKIVFTPPTSPKKAIIKTGLYQDLF